MYIKENHPLFVYPGQKEDASSSVPINDLKVILSLAREQYLKMMDSTLPSTAPCITDDQKSFSTKNSGTVF